MKEVIERCNWLVNKCNDKAITPDVKDDFRYLLEEIERLNSIIKEVKEYIEKTSDNEYSYGDYEIHYEVKKELLEILDKVRE